MAIRLSGRPPRSDSGMPTHYSSSPNGPRSRIGNHIRGPTPIRCATRYVEKPTRRMGGNPGSTPTGTRTPVPWLRTKYPRPLDDGGMLTNGIISSWGSQSSLCQSPDDITASGLVGTSHSTVIMPSLPLCDPKPEKFAAARRQYAGSQRTRIVPELTRRSPPAMQGCLGGPHPRCSPS